MTEQKRMTDRFASTLVIAASIIAAVRLAREPLLAAVFVSPSTPLAHRFDMRICLSLHRMSGQCSETILEARSAVAAQVKTSVKYNGVDSRLRVAKICCGVMTNGL